jgi:protein-L-isoaspartate(D-aspartate) O-methyltransferase
MKIKHFWRRDCTLLLLLALMSCAHMNGKGQDDHDHRRKMMVRDQLAARGISDQSVLAAMRKVERHRFVPESLVEYAYTDRPLPIGHAQTISQPFIVAYMTEAALLRPGDRVLEIGTGSGYQAAVMAELVDSVYTVEIIQPLAEQSRRLFAALGYNNIFVRHGDGYQGWPEFAPFDVILVTAAAPQIPQPLLDQLAEGGRLIIPVGGSSEVQELLRLTKRNERIRTERLLPVRFVPFTREKEG